jgi:hypothetical protein
MPGEVSISGLLDCAQNLLSDAIAPHLDPDRRYLAAMIGSAMRMAARECEQAERLAGARAALLDIVGQAPALSDDPQADAAEALVDAIRGGDLDADPHAHGLLWADAVLRTSVTKPSALSRIERRMAGLPGEEIDT